jgi:hypothetical protein
MAPFRGPDKARVLRQLRATPPSGFPLTLGRHSPEAVIAAEDGRWTLRPLVMNEARAAPARVAGLAEGFWMPESEWQFLEPGPPQLEAPTAAALADAIEKLFWWRY